MTPSLRDAFKGQEELDLTSGGIGWPLFYLSLPIVITNLLQVAYNLADTFWLGWYSTESLAAISFGFPMVFLLISVAMGLSVAGSVLVAQHTGAGETDEAEYAASQTVVFAVATSAVVGALGYFFVDDFLRILGASPEILPLATIYMQIISLGLPFMFGFFVFISLMRGAGDTITPMQVMFGSVVVNIVIDPVFIFGWGPVPELGIAGAALATIFARGLATVVGLGIMFAGTRGVRIHARYLVPDLEYAAKIARIGLPASLEGMTRSVSINVMLFFVALFPTAVVAAFGVGTRIFSVIFLPAMGVSHGVETMTGQNVGADEPDRAAATNHFAARVTFLILSAAGLLTLVIAEPVVSVFTSDPDVVEVGAQFLRYVAVTFGCIGVLRAYTGGFRGTGQTMVAALIAVFTLWIVRLPVAWIGSVAIGHQGIWLSFAVSNAAGATLAYLWFRRGTWRDVDVRTRGPAPADDD